LRIFRLAAVFAAASCAILLPGCPRRRSDSRERSRSDSASTRLVSATGACGFLRRQLLGYYKAEGLDVSLLPLPPIRKCGRSWWRRGKADIGLGSSDQILEWDSNGIAADGDFGKPCSTIRRRSWCIRTRRFTISRISKAIPLRRKRRDVVEVRDLAYNLHEVRQIPSTLSIANFLAGSRICAADFCDQRNLFFAKQAGAEVRTCADQFHGLRSLRVSFTTRDFAASNPRVGAKFVRASIRGGKRTWRPGGGERRFAES